MCFWIWFNTDSSQQWQRSVCLQPLLLHCLTCFWITSTSGSHCKLCYYAITCRQDPANMAASGIEPWSFGQKLTFGAFGNSTKQHIPSLQRWLKKHAWKNDVRNRNDASMLRLSKVILFFYNLWKWLRLCKRSCWITRSSPFPFHSGLELGDLCNVQLEAAAPKNVQPPSAQAGLTSLSCCCCCWFCCCCCCCCCCGRLRLAVTAVVCHNILYSWGSNQLVIVQR